MKAIDLYHKFTALLALCLLALIPATASAQQQRTVYCMGEMVIDILFRGQEPVGAYAGGSALNSAVSLGRAGVNVEFMGEVGSDSTGTGTTSYPVEKIKTVSTIGAGDNFNAGFIYGLVRQGITRAQLAGGLDKAVWQRLEDTAQLFSQDCCKHLSNYISPGLAAKLRAQE